MLYNSIKDRNIYKYKDQFNIKEVMPMKLSCQDIKECPYCSLIRQSHKIQENLLSWDKILFETDNFLVTPTLGSIIEGWLLVIPKTHHLSFGAIPVGLQDELSMVLQKTTHVIESVYGEPTIFEHGPAMPHTKVGCGIDHAHLHLVSLRESLIKRAEEYNCQPLSISQYTDGDFNLMRNLFVSKTPYLFVREPSGTRMFFDAQNAPSQFFRRVIAEIYGINDKYDYHVYSFEENVVSTIAKTMPLFNSELACYM